MVITTTDYADLKEVKERLNIPQVNIDSDEKIGTHMRDADSFINSQIAVHTNVPLTNPDKHLISLASGLGASLYNYWQTPAKERTLEGVTAWENRITNYLRATYGQTDLSGHSGRTFSSTRGVTGTE